MTKLMKAVLCRRYAGLNEDGKPIPIPEPLNNVLALDTIPTPQCQDRHVLVLTH